MPVCGTAYVDVLPFCRRSFCSRESCRSNCSRAIWRPIRRARRSTGSFEAMSASADSTVPTELGPFFPIPFRCSAITLAIPPTIGEFMRGCSISDEKANLGKTQGTATIACKSAGDGSDWREGNARKRAALERADRSDAKEAICSNLRIHLLERVIIRFCIADTALPSEAEGCRFKSCGMWHSLWKIQTRSAQPNVAVCVPLPNPTGCSTSPQC